MTAIPADHTLTARPDQPTRDIAFWGMALFCAAEAALFASLLAGYFYVGVFNTRWPPDGVHDPKLLLPLLMTGLLLLSSLAYWWGEQGVKQGRVGRLRLGLLFSALLGLGFLALQTREYLEKVKEFTPQSSSYGSLFYTITGFHGSHVAFGVLMIGFTLVRALRGHFSAHRHTAVTCVGLYWHFVDAVWLCILASLYLSPRLY